MIKRILLCSIFLSIFFISSAPINQNKTIIIIYDKPLIKGFNHYFDDLGYRETGESPDTVNEIGCFAKHQWKESTLHTLGLTWITLKEFKKDPRSFPDSTQCLALKLLNITNYIDLYDLNPYIGTYINGVEITKSGLLAAAHLAGSLNVKKYILTNGKYIIIDGWKIPIKTNHNKIKYNKHDMYGTSINDYLKEFAYYDL